MYPPRHPKAIFSICASVALVIGALTITVHDGVVPSLPTVAVALPAPLASVPVSTSTSVPSTVPALPPIEIVSMDTERTVSPSTTTATTLPTEVERPASPSVPSADFVDGFDMPDGLVTNGFAHSNPSHNEIITSPIWWVTSGSLFARNGHGWTGVPDGNRSKFDSSDHTGSSVFRMGTFRNDFHNVRVGMDLKVNGFSSTERTPEVDWDGVHIWLRFQSETTLYAASVARRDGRVVIKKKCDGGTSNGGTYYSLSKDIEIGPLPDGLTQVAASVEDLDDGTVRLRIWRGETLVADAIDAGVGCPPIRGAGQVGIRTDNVDAEFDNFVVSGI